MVDAAQARKLGLVRALRSHTYTSAPDLAARFGVTERTIYRDIESLAANGIPVEAATGAGGGYRLASDDPLDPFLLDSDQVLRVYALGFLDTTNPDTTGEERHQAAGVSARIKEVLRRLAQRIHFDTADWYWRDEGSGHMPVLRAAMLTSTAVDVTYRTKDGTQKTAILKPYGVVWKAGEWHMVAAAPGGPPERFRLNLVDRLQLTDLSFTYPADFTVGAWWAETMEEYGKGDAPVILRVSPAARDELLRLSLKSTSKVAEHDDGSVTITLFVDRWEWLIPLVSSYGPDVIVTEPAELRAAIIQLYQRALAAYEPAADSGPGPPAPRHSHDDARIRTTHGRHPGA